ncbi:hypothetical protein [Streptomyces sp. cg35]|uniref:hypothetical protein n=1 Tax=Streptomyces sp. cg35 TaxID=3421650 RepID=UPI003D173B1E
MQNDTTERFTLGGTVRLVRARADGTRIELSLTRGAERTTAVYAATDPTGRIAACSARSWPNNADAEPGLASTIRKALAESSS